ncbi:hypothetical protein [Hydrogenophaga sp. PAMC20947]|uniref:hypothetical protein n=1 Tax=Hydrogenophaga sp. PAMC20947 TaxID=2565558 RepID=UPI0014474789|nr:hypothetical protein [Hydrogenophaga sp. PAMC20947]
MFERLKKAFSAAPSPRELDDGLAQWAISHMLSHHRLPNGATAAEGLLHDKAFKAGCAPSTRPYIVGVELLAKAELDLREDVNIIVMHRTLKRALDKAAVNLFAEVTDTLRTTDRPLPEELAWLSMYRDAGWPGPSTDFWSRYCVLTDAPEAAREWLDEESIELLMDMPVELRPVTPFLIAFTRGKLYLHLQMEHADDGVISHPVLDAVEALSARALRLFGR